MLEAHTFLLLLQVFGLVVDWKDGLFELGQAFLERGEDPDHSTGQLRAPRRCFLQEGKACHLLLCGKK